MPSFQISCYGLLCDVARRAPIVWSEPAGDAARVTTPPADAQAQISPLETELCRSMKVALTRSYPAALSERRRVAEMASIDSSSTMRSTS
jgi:hypothetical protein